jgi:hypothetical protein
LFIGLYWFWVFAIHKVLHCKTLQACLKWSKQKSILDRRIGKAMYFCRQEQTQQSAVALAELL